MTGPPRIPGYTFVQHIGQGGFADVFLYEQQWPRQRVAIKVVRADIPLTEREKSMVAVEADAMARLADHPFIVSVITAGITSEEEGSRPYLVMRYCPPPDLGQRVQAKPMSVSEAVATGIKLASAIETAHRADILHRDIKPSNVLITPYSEPAITDFGIAGYLHETNGDADVRISYPWSAPELLDGRSNGSVATDVYSLGATIWNLLVGRSPFSIPGGDNSPRALTARILHSAPPRTRRPDVPPALDLLLQQAMAKDARHRPRSALELARALQRIEAQQGFPRTMIAVEADLPAMQDVSAHGSEDDTALRPATIASATITSGTSSPGAVELPPQATGGEPHDMDSRRVERLRTGWQLAAAAVLAAIAVVLFVTAGDDESSPTTEPTRSASTPGSLDPGAPNEAPDVTGRRTAAGVVFEWTSPDGTLADDSWQWRRTDTGEDERTEDASVILPADERVCVQVRLIRGGFTSPWSTTCVD